MVKMKLSLLKPVLKGAQRIERANPEIRDTVDEMLFTGETSYAIRVKLASEWTEMAEVVGRTLERAIDAYKDTEASKERQKALQDAKDALMVKRYDRNVDVLMELQDLALLQRGRLMKTYEQEKDMPKGTLLKQVTNEAMNYKTILSEVGRLQLELGIIQKAPRKVTGVIPGADGAMTQFSWTEEYEGLMEMVKKGATPR